MKKIKDIVRTIMRIIDYVYNKYKKILELRRAFK